jgi:hypothetical protein
MIITTPQAQDFLNPLDPRKPVLKEGEKIITEEVKKNETQKSILG